MVIAAGSREIRRDNVGAGAAGAIEPGAAAASDAAGATDDDGVVGVAQQLRHFRDLIAQRHYGDEAVASSSNQPAQLWF